ncbi:hypothetical protein GCK32_005647 [Trichostrongylus colubriformis]|uniref:Pentatricopeptide repeat-containing protein n=1 Tax=Trichostrongylus colubriformis TaxID=6319 RepID=A0AAN8IRR0_TRICO
MMKYRNLPLQLRFLRYQHPSRSTSEVRSHGSSFSCDCSYADLIPAEGSNHWFLNQISVINMRSHSAPQQTVRKLRSFDDFGSLSAHNVNSEQTQSFARAVPFMEALSSSSCIEIPSTSNTATIPTTADLSEMGGSSETSDIEHLEELKDRWCDISAVLPDMPIDEVQREPYASVSGVVVQRACYGKQCHDKEQSHLSLKHGNNNRSAHREDCLPSSSNQSMSSRFYPDNHRESVASPHEIITAVHNQDISLLRSILTAMRWPDHRSIGIYLDQLFEIVIRDSYDIDEAVMFLQDFAVCNRRGFLHEVNGVRLALRVACDSGTVETASEMLRVFRNMFLVNSPVTVKSTVPASILDDFYSKLCSIGSSDQVERVYKTMFNLGFDKNAATFIRNVTNSMIEKGDISGTFGEWQRLSARYGTTVGSELLWQGLLTIRNRTEQARLANKLLKHCCQHDHPLSVISNLIVALVSANHLDAAKALLIKVAVPGKFFKKPLSCMARYESSAKAIENFADLVTQCMLSEKRRVREAKETIGNTCVLSPELSSVLDSFYGMGRLQRLQSNRDSSRRKLHRVNDEQLFELCQFVQLLWLEKAEESGNVNAIDRLISWTFKNQLEIPANLKQRIVELSLMFGLRRGAVLQVRHVRSMASVASQPFNRQQRVPFGRDNSRAKKSLPLLPAEQLRLQNKHRDSLESNRAQSLQEIVEHIEWRGVVYSETPEKVAKLLADLKEDLTLLSDRQLSILLSTFGNGCESVSSLRRAAFMSQAIEALRQRGVVLGSLSRNAILSARIDNGENVSAVEELRDWETAGVLPDVETYALLSKVYAFTANTQAIVDVINYMKSTGLPVPEKILESLIYSLARGGHYKQAVASVQRFAASANEVAFRSAIARAAVSRGDISIAVSTIASIPSAAKPNQISNNKYILEVLMEMLEMGEVGALEKISPYLTMEPDGSSLVEWHLNPKVMARSRRACAEGKLDMALALYGLLHPKFKNRNFELLLADALGNRIKDASHAIDEIFALAKSMQENGLLRDHVEFLLEKSISTPRAYEVLSIVRTRGLLGKCLLEKPVLRKALARKLSEQLTVSKTAKEQRVRLLADLATPSMLQHNPNCLVEEMLTLRFPPSKVYRMHMYVKSTQQH